MWEWFKQIWIWVLAWSFFVVENIVHWTPQRAEKLSNPLLILAFLSFITISYWSFYNDNDKIKENQPKKPKLNTNRLNRRIETLINLGFFDNLLWKYEIENLKNEIFASSLERNQLDISKISFYINAMSIYRPEYLLYTFQNYQKFLAENNINIKIGTYYEEWGTDYWIKRNIEIDGVLYEFDDSEAHNNAFYTRETENTIDHFEHFANQILCKHNPSLLLANYHQYETFDYVLIEKRNKKTIVELQKILGLKT